MRSGVQIACNGRHGLVQNGQSKFRREPALLNSDSYPDAIDADLVGTYPATAEAGGGCVWDDVLEYRVWCHPERGAADLENGNDYYFAFATYAEASAFSDRTEGTEEPLALIRQ